MALRRFQIAVEGIAPLLLSNNAPSDPLSEAAKLKKHFTSKNKKVDEDVQNMRLIDWVYSGYWSIPGKVLLDDVENSLSFDGFSDLYMPDQNFARCLRNGATAWRLGKETTRAIQVENNPLIEFDGPDTAEDLLQNSKFVHTAPVVRKGSTNWITRVVIPQWKCDFKVSIDDERISVDNLTNICSAAGRFEGLGTWRPRYGRFVSTLNEID